MVPARQTSRTKRWETIKTTPKSTWDSFHTPHSHTDVINVGTPILVSPKSPFTPCHANMRPQYDITDIKHLLPTKGAATEHIANQEYRSNDWWRLPRGEDMHLWSEIDSKLELFSFPP